jgi:cytochrome b561
MKARDSSERHDGVAMFLHWTMAMLLMALLGIGWYMVGLPKRTPEVGFFYNLHKSLGLVALALILVRVAWRLQSALPRHAGLAPGFRMAGRVAHLVLYLLMLWLPVCGFLASSFGKHPVKFFGYGLPRLFAENAMLASLFKQLHLLLGWGLALMILLHLAAVAWHGFAEGRVFIRRMLPIR